MQSIAIGNCPLVLSFPLIHFNQPPREADELEQQMEKDTAMLESLQIEKREKMNKKKEAEIKLEKEKRRLEKLDSKIRLMEKGDLNDDQSESRTYSEVD